MTDEQRGILEHNARYAWWSESDAIRAALAEIDRLRVELAEAQRMADEARAMEHQTATKLCDRLDELAALKVENDKIKAWMANAILDGKIKAEPLRPEAIVRLLGWKWHLFEVNADCHQFCIDQARAGCPTDAWNVSEWIYHPKGESRE